MKFKISVLSFALTLLSCQGHLASTREHADADLISGTYVGHVTTSKGLAALTFSKDKTFLLNSHVASNLLYRSPCQGVWAPGETTSGGGREVHFTCYRSQQAQPGSDACGKPGGSCVAILKGTAALHENVMKGIWFTVAVDTVSHEELAARNLDVPFTARRVATDDFRSLPYPPVVR